MGLKRDWKGIGKKLERDWKGGVTWQQVDEHAHDFVDGAEHQTAAPYDESPR